MVLFQPFFFRDFPFCWCLFTLYQDDVVIKNTSRQSMVTAAGEMAIHLSACTLIYLARQVNFLPILPSLADLCLWPGTHGLILV